MGMGLIFSGACDADSLAQTRDSGEAVIVLQDHSTTVSKEVTLQPCAMGWAVKVIMYLRDGGTGAMRCVRARRKHSSKASTDRRGFGRRSPAFMYRDASGSTDQQLRRLVISVPFQWLVATSRVLLPISITSNTRCTFLTAAKQRFASFMDITFRIANHVLSKGEETRIREPHTVIQNRTRRPPSS